MKKAVFVFLLIPLFLTTGCRTFSDRFSKVTELNYNATEAKNIELIYSCNVQKPYEPIGFIVIALCFRCAVPVLPKDQTEDLKRLKELAAKNGADAVVNITLHESHPFFIMGLAVKWK